MPTILLILCVLPKCAQEIQRIKKWTLMMPHPPKLPFLAFSFLCCVCSTLQNIVYFKIISNIQSYKNSTNIFHGYLTRSPKGLKFNYLFFFKSLVRCINIHNICSIFQVWEEQMSLNILICFSKNSVFIQSQQSNQNLETKINRKLVRW